MSHYENSTGYRCRRRRSERASRRDQEEAALTAQKIWLRRKEANVITKKVAKEYNQDIWSLTTEL